MDHEAFLRRALELARIHSARGDAGPFGAVVVREGLVVGEGWNQVVEGRDPTAHAEIQALRAAARALGTHDLRGAVLYSSCEPCPMCLAAIYWSRIRTVYFAAAAEDAAKAGFDDVRIARELALPWEERAVKGIRLLEGEGSEVLEAWLANPKRIPY